MIVLATKSIARRKLIKKCKKNAVFLVSNVDEARLEEEPVVDYLLRISFLKAVKVHKDRHITIGADTVIYSGGKIIGKPKNRQEAFDILMSLSDKVHEVFTGVSVIRKDLCMSFVDVARVKVEKLNKDTINRYLDTGEYVGRAAGYAIQGRARHFMKVVEGDITTVIGLPMKKLCKII